MANKSPIYKKNTNIFLENFYSPKNSIYSNIKKNKNIGINLTKVKILYSECYKTLLKETEDLNNWPKKISHSWIRRFNTVKVAIFPKLIYRFSATLPDFFCRN